MTKSKRQKFQEYYEEYYQNKNIFRKFARVFNPFLSILKFVNQNSQVFFLALGFYQAKTVTSQVTSMAKDFQEKIQLVDRKLESIENSIKPPSFTDRYIKPMILALGQEALRQGSVFSITRLVTLPNTNEKIQALENQLHYSVKEKDEISIEKRKALLANEAFAEQEKFLKNRISALTLWNILTSF